jgi:Tfp pilus assembly protein PilO
MEWFNTFLEKHEDRIESVRKYQKYIYIALILFTWAQLFFMVVQPKIQAHKLKKQKFKDFQKILQIKKAKTLNKANVEKELQKLQTKLVAQETMLFDLIGFHEFYINQISRIAENAGASVKTVSVTKGSNSKGLQEFSVNLSLKGDFFTIMDFFKRLENYSKIIRINKFQLARQSVKPVILSCGLSLQAFVKEK